MAAHNDFGAEGERLAGELLERNGWTVVARNWRFGHHEIDLIVRRGQLVAFVEVRARKRALHGHPLETIDWRKQRRLARAATAWVARHGRSNDEYRFDAIHVLRDPPEVYHTEDAWSMPDD